MTDPQIKVGWSTGGSWIWSGPFTVSRSFTVKYSYFCFTGFEDEPDDVQLAVYINSNLDACFVHIAYIQCQITYDRPGEKIGVFFWATNTYTSTNINRYIDILEDDEGYTTIFDFDNTNNFVADMQSVDDYEIATDTIFFYLNGHGYTPVSEHSGVKLKAGGSYIWSDDFCDELDDLEAGRIGFLIEACYSGGFADDCDKSPYLAMSTSNTLRVSWAYDRELGIPDSEGCFSYYFWNHVEDGCSASASFSYARTFVSGESSGWPVIQYQYPIKNDNSDYTFFS